MKQSELRNTILQTFSEMLLNFFHEDHPYFTKEQLDMALRNHIVTGEDFLQSIHRIFEEK